MLNMASKINKFSQPKVSIVFVTWEGKKYTFDLLDSLKKIKYKNYDIIVVDNGSTDGTQKEFKKKYRKIATLIENKKNLGLAEGLNIGMRKALKRNSKYIFIMGNDMIAKPDFLDFLVDAMKRHPEVSVVGPKIYFMEPKNMIYGAGCDYTIARFKPRNSKEIDIGQTEEEKYVDAIDGAIMMRSNLLKKYGLLESKLFLFHEIAEWCMRTKKFGYKTLYVPKSIMWHKESASPAFSGKKSLERSIYYTIRNWPLIIKKNKNYLYYLSVLFLQLTVFALIRFMRYLKNNQLYLIKTYYIATWHAIINKTPLELYPYKK